MSVGEKFFAKEDRLKTEAIPPTSAALAKHVTRASYIAGHYWGQSLITNQVLPLPHDWGWKLQNGQLVIDWTSLPEASLAIRDLYKMPENQLYTKLQMLEVRCTLYSFMPLQRRL